MFKKYTYFLPTLSQCWSLILLFIVGQILAGFALMPLLLIFPKSEFISKCLAYGLSFIPILIHAYRQGKKSLHELEILGAQSEIVSVKINAPYFGKFNPVLFFILIFISSFAFSIAVDPLVSWMEVPEWFEKMMLKMLEGNIIYTFITVAVLAPILEEWLCRGLIMRGLLKHISPTKAIIWSAALFAIMHLNPWQAIPAFIIGCFYGWIYYKTRCIWAPIFLHFVNNAFATLMFVAYPEVSMSDDSLSDLLPDQATYWMLVSVAVGIISLSIFLIDRYIKPNNDEQTIPTKI